MGKVDLGGTTSLVAGNLAVTTVRSLAHHMTTPTQTAGG